ncbi:hypothetical protein G6F35_011723 [Rhizopus arrhizus]|nr:hypothetical protein G6F23_008805 [Rhizopus arrhizus]KAG1205307.1 hypothetical protein G6F35_011723 [Rhizopus arrhizus]
MNSLQSKFKSFSISASDSKNKSSEKSQLTSNPSQKKILDDLETTPKSVLRAKLKKLPKTQVNMKKGSKSSQERSIKFTFLNSRNTNGRLSNDCGHYQRSRSPVHTYGRATAEIYQEFQHVVENGGTEADMSNILEWIR